MLGRFRKLKELAESLGHPQKQSCSDGDLPPGPMHAAAGTARHRCSLHIGAMRHGIAAWLPTAGNQRRPGVPSAGLKQVRDYCGTACEVLAQQWLMQQYSGHQMRWAVPAGRYRVEGTASSAAAAAGPYGIGSGGSSQRTRRRSAAASSAAARSQEGCVLGGGVGSSEERAWELYECADLLARQLGVDSDEALSWLDKAVRKRELAAAKQLETGALQMAATTGINTAQVQQLLDVLSGIIGMQPADMAAMLREWPRYLACEPAQPRSAGRFLREELGLTAETAASLLRRTPWLLAMEVDILQQRRSAWQRGFGLSDAQLAKVLGRQPHLISYTVTGIEEQAAAVLAWYRARGWTADDVVKMGSTQPMLLARHCSTLQTNLDRFVDVCGLSQEQAAAACRSCPTVLTKNMATPGNERKLDFLQRVIGRPRADVVQFPVYVSQSLENVIAPRTYFMRACGRELSRTLSYLREAHPVFCKRCGCTEAEFGEWLAAWRQTPEGRQWGSKAATSAAVEPQRQ